MSVTTTASTAPAAPIRLPLRAVLRRRQPLEREDEADGCDEVEQPDPGVAHALGLSSELARGACLGLNISQHPVGDHEPADHVHRGQHDGDQPERPARRPVRLAGDDDRADQDHAVDGVGARHQRRVQRRRHLGDDLEADEHGQHEDRQQADAVHQPSSGNVMPSRSAPSRVTQQPATISSSQSRRHGAGLAQSSEQRRDVARSRACEESTGSCDGTSRAPHTVDTADAGSPRRRPSPRRCRRTRRRGRPRPSPAFIACDHRRR